MHLHRGIDEEIVEDVYQNNNYLLLPYFNYEESPQTIRILFEHYRNYQSYRRDLAIFTETRRRERLRREQLLPRETVREASIKVPNCCERFGVLCYMFLICIVVSLVVFGFLHYFTMFVWSLIKKM